MQILISLPQDKIEKVNKISKHAYTGLDSRVNKESVAVIVEGENFAANINKAITLDIPVVVIAGTKNKAGEKLAREACSYGIPEQCIILKDRDNISSLDGRILNTSKRGIGYRLLEQICEDVLKNELYPEILIWEEPREIGENPKANVEKASVEELSRAVKNKPTAKTPGPEQEPQKPEIARTDIETFLKSAKDITVVFKTTSSSDSARVSQIISDRLEAVHLEIAESSCSYVYYADGKDSALETGKYAYSDGRAVEGIKPDSRQLVVEIDAVKVDNKSSISEAMILVYEKASRIIHVAGSDLKETKTAIDSWLAGNFKLDGIICTDLADAHELKKTYQDLACDVDTFLKKVVV